MLLNEYSLMLILKSAIKVEHIFKGTRQKVVFPCVTHTDPEAVS